MTRRDFFRLLPAVAATVVFVGKVLPELPRLLPIDCAVPPGTYRINHTVMLATGAHLHDSTFLLGPNGRFEVIASARNVRMERCYLRTVRA